MLEEKGVKVHTPYQLYSLCAHFFCFEKPLCQGSRYWRGPWRAFPPPGWASWWGRTPRKRWRWKKQCCLFSHSSDLKAVRRICSHRAQGVFFRQVIIRIRTRMCKIHQINKSSQIDIKENTFLTLVFNISPYWSWLNIEVTHPSFVETLTTSRQYWTFTGNRFRKSRYTWIVETVPATYIALQHRPTFWSSRVSKN